MGKQGWDLWKLMAGFGLITGGVYARMPSSVGTSQNTEVGMDA